MRVNSPLIALSCYHPAKFGGHRHCGSGDMAWSLNLERTSDQRVDKLYGQEHLKVSQVFHGLRHSDCGNIILLVCHSISQSHMIKGSFDFFAGSSSW